MIMLDNAEKTYWLWNKTSSLWNETWIKTTMLGQAQKQVVRIEILGPGLGNIGSLRRWLSH
jgi:hypothetical protein